MSPKTLPKESASRRTHGAIFTVGYEGRTLDALLDLLAYHKISTVIDVRHRPSSRRRDFSKAPLAAALAKRKISYFHLPELGVPRDVRDQYQLQKDLGVLRRFLRSSLDQYRHLAQEIVGKSPDRNVCLLCLEKEPARCHRSIVAEDLAQRDDVEIHHL